MFQTTSPRGGPRRRRSDAPPAGSVVFARPPAVRDRDPVDDRRPGDGGPGRANDPEPMTRDDTGSTDCIDSESPSRTAVLDDVGGRERGGLAGAADPSAGSTGPSASRRSLLGAVGAVGATALTGCLGAVTGKEAAFHAPPALLRLPPLEKRRDDDARFEMAPVQVVQASGTVERFGFSRDVVATAWGATYGLVMDLGGVDAPGHFLAQDGREALVGEEILVSVPKVEVAGRRLVDPGELSASEVIERVGRGERSAGANGPASEDGLLRGTALDLSGTVGDFLRNAYGGTVAGLSDVAISPEGAQNLAESAERPMLFEATARRLVDGGDVRLVGAVQRVELDNAYVFRASTRTAPETLSASPARALGAAGERGSEMALLDVGSGGGDDGPLPISLIGAKDIDDWDLLKTCLERRRDCIANCYDMYEGGSDAWGDCKNKCPTCGHLPPYGVVVGPKQAPVVSLDEDLVVACSGTTSDSSVCVGDVVEKYAEVQVSKRQWTE